MAQTSQDRNPSPDLAEIMCFFHHLIHFPNIPPVKPTSMEPDYPTPYIGHKKSFRWSQAMSVIY